MARSPVTSCQYSDTTRPRGRNLGLLLTIRIHDVKTTRDSTNHHTADLEREEGQRHGIPILASQETIGRSAPAENADAPEYKLRDDQHDAELGLVDAIVAPGHHLGGPIRQPAGDEEPDDGADEGGCVRVAGLDLVPPQRVAQEEGAEDDADEDGPADQGALDQARPQEGGLQEEWEGPQGELPEGLVGLAAVEEREGAQVAGLGRDGCRGATGGWFGAVSVDGLLGVLAVVVPG